MHNISYFILSYSLVIQSPNHIAAVPSKDISKQQNSPIHIQVRKVCSYVAIDDCIVFVYVQTEYVHDILHDDYCLLTLSVHACEL